MSGLIMKYFVLKPEGDDIYAQSSRRAMRAYAKLIQVENPELAKELVEWADREYEAMAERGGPRSISERGQEWQ